MNISENPVAISIVHGNPLIWDAEDVFRLRQEHRIVGNLVGCLPRKPRQNIHLGLPLQLLPEEVSLLVETGLCTLVDGSSPPSRPAQQDVRQFVEHRQQLYEQQAKILLDENRKEVLRMKDKILAGKRAKQQKVIAAKLARGESVSEQERNKQVDFDIDKMIANTKPIDRKNSLVQICTATPGSRSSESRTVEWKFPLTPAEQLRCQVFRDLWQQQYFLSPGAKFGGDFLVYPGDPARYHSFYIAVCLPRDKQLNGREIAAMARLGSDVKKTVLLCSVDERDNVQYTSLQWTGIS